MDQENGSSGAAAGEYYALPSVLDFAVAPALLQALRQHVTLADPVVLDGHAVERVSTAIPSDTACSRLGRAVARDIVPAARALSLALTNAIAELDLSSSFDQ